MQTKNSKGFSLIEVLVATAVLMVSLLLALTMLNQALRLHHANLLRDAALNLARNEIELAKSQSPEARESGTLSRSVPELPQSTLTRAVSRLDSVCNIEVSVKWIVREKESHVDLFTALYEVPKR